MSYDVALLIPDAKGDEMTVWDGNYTSNLAGAWDDAGIRIRDWGKHQRAGDLANQVREGIQWIEGLPHYFSRYEPDNGWGSVGDMIDFFLDPMLDAMERWPDARVSVWR